MAQARLVAFEQPAGSKQYMYVSVTRYYPHRVFQSSYLKLSKFDVLARSLGKAQCPSLVMHPRSAA
ncbi:hypothetical protein CCM_07534 [Cordyceps militaris CM01]|uniref:Uncharacterized protein n=1 Tax=Cordyceps militaris (strain CM01) TaxID=983644 RepID=G3JQ31_CORMM|nr:uncharacterized protein CCM_07534 [Cordyceps militaris CM01]EGX89282.1 hypothetical protein CCM_07534 [Cordyceps militaris CM01]